MRHRGELNAETIAAIHPGDEYLPPFVKTELKCQDKSITANECNKHNYKDMVWNCTHLTVNQQNQLINLFSDYANLFDGTIGTIPGKPGFNYATCFDMNRGYYHFLFDDFAQ
eukprot:3651116-Ditylum_brightwellii.AAC.1